MYKAPLWPSQSTTMNTATENPTNANPAEQNTANSNQSGRDENGRFKKGNRGGPGNPFARQTAKLRQALVNAITEEDMQIALNALRENVKQGDVAAIKLLFSYAAGKPAEATNPDTLDQDELQ